MKRNYRVKPGDVVTLMLTRPRFDSSIKGEDIPLEIVYEDDQLMVINKPAGMVRTSRMRKLQWDVSQCPLRGILREQPDYDPNDPTVGLVHRIDKDTSGLLVVAKTPEAKTHLVRPILPQNHRRRYNAVVWGQLSGRPWAD